MSFVEAIKASRERCKSGKIKYPTIGVAAHHAAQFREAHKDPAIRPYFCEHCGFYHLGHPKK